MAKTSWWSYFLSIHVLFIFLLEIIFYLQCIDFLISINTMKILLLFFIIKIWFQVHVLVSKLHFEIRNLYGVDKLNALIFPFIIFLICLIHLCDYLLLNQWDISWLIFEFCVYLEPLNQLSTILKKPIHKTLKILLQ